jgi:6-phosphogluconolactonase
MIHNKIRVYPNLESLSQAAADLFVERAQKSISERGRFTAALSGGSTPRPLYQALASPESQEELDWQKIHLFWGDERCVPPDHPDSNYRMVRENLLQEISIPEENIHRVPAEMDPRMAAFSYEETLRGFFNQSWPRFDLVLLGMGDDGHTASLFPHSAGLNEEQRWFIANYAPRQETWRLTLTKKAINAARYITVLVSGGSKADMLFSVFRGDYDPETKPIQLISPKKGELVWLVDQAAATKLTESSNKRVE